jgi:hypothetical protein
METKGPEVICGQMAKILIVVDDEHVKPVRSARSNAWSLG